MQVEIELKVTFDTPFNIGTGAMADSVADKPLIKDAGRRPVIPGSSLKGKVRHECERIIQALITDFHQHWDCRPPLPDNMCKADPTTTGWREAICPICRVFGAPWNPAPITFDNLTLATAAEEPPPHGWERLRSVRATNLRPGVGIGRERGVAEEDLLYSTETYAPPSALVYDGRIWGTLEERREVALLLAGLRSVCTLGGARSRGLGWWRLEVAVSVDGQSASVDELLQELDRWSN